ncbi:conserved hypothetical protein [Vibrio nigripulchritudo SFn27]|uniref:Uncharacterized protein n=1 Tax=Vibrio nigripulchritudo TaxID=28173 RepID=U4KDQ3_9VIBR|nr:conserved hypothetical protein [Vibrio nigripulchritudo BLFn1]CCN91544.1 conserved hypothetical protein [Vibrio nigripulchritudo SFn27]CCN93421.1 conserved hypothetical protein [Vibrio nigripulchritudo ENn2]CCO42092.1 conserved hypothetical protein [Vibrio nigripulchritudo SFn135]CCO54394.1 conserved hypothetical protein [Vibrio nigripulchritudo Wn13]CCO61201.1 conserved hypothetical protein [Vibrio nigripulchritudo]
MTSPSKWLASLIFGVWLSPTLFIAQGFLGGFGWQFSAIALPFLFVSQCYLFYTCILNRKTFTNCLISIPLAFVAWLIVSLFIAVVSSVNLIVGMERLGLISLTTLVGCLVAFVFSLFYQTPLEKHLSSYNRYFVFLSFVLPMIGMTVITASWLLSETKFI